MADKIQAYEAFYKKIDYDFTIEKIRDLVMKDIDKNDIDLVVFSTMHKIQFSLRKRVARRQKMAATVHIDFCI